MFSQRAQVLVSVAVFVAAISVTPIARAQFGSGAPPPRASSSTHSSSSTSAPSLGTPWGTRPEHWLAAGLALALGAATVATGTGMYRYAVDLNAHAGATTTTQADAAASVNTARDYVLVAEVLWSVGAALAAIGISWVIVLSFSTPVPAVEPATVPPAATAPSAALRLSPLGVTLEGRF